MRDKFNAAEFRCEPKMIAEQLNKALVAGDIGAFTKTIGEVARARGASQIARELGVDRQRLYRSFNAEAKPQIDTVFKVLAALGLELKVEAK
jgi:probable addiction module antidote protein